MPFVSGAVAFTLAVLATSVTNIALPSIKDDIGGGVSGLQWVVNGYALMLASLLLSMGVLCDQRGARRVMTGGLCVFASGGALAASAPSLGVLVAAQLIKGAAAAALIPAALAIVAHAYDDARRQARAVAAISAVSGIATAAGPVVAGLLVDTISWRAIFCIDVIGALVLLVPVRLWLQETPLGRARHLDVPGQVLAVVALAALTYGVVHSGIGGWGSVGTFGPVVLAVVAAVAFARVELRSEAPMFPPALLRIRAFNTASAGCALANFAFYGQIFVLSLYMQDLRGMRRCTRGSCSASSRWRPACSSFAAGHVTGARGARLPGTLGSLLCVASMATLLAAGEGGSLLPVVIACVGLGFGTGFAVPALTAGLMGGVPAGQRGVAAAGFTTARQVGGLLGVAVLGTLVASGDFVASMHVTQLLGAGAFLVAAIISAIWVVDRPTGATVNAVPGPAG